MHKRYTYTNGRYAEWYTYKQTVYITQTVGTHKHVRQTYTKCNLQVDMIEERQALSWLSQLNSSLQQGLGVYSPFTNPQSVFIWATQAWCTHAIRDSTANFNCSGVTDSKFCSVDLTSQSQGIMSRIFIGRRKYFLTVIFPSFMAWVCKLMKFGLVWMVDAKWSWLGESDALAACMHAFITTV